MDLTTGDMLILSGEGDNGSWERYFGARTAKAIRSKLSRERCGGDRWASVWIETGKDDLGNTAYGKLDASFDGIVSQRSVEQDDIRENPAARLASLKRGRSASSAENGRAGGRPRQPSDRLPMELAVSKDGKPRTLRLVNRGGRQYTCVVLYPDGQQVQAQIQPDGTDFPDLYFLAEKNGFSF